MVVDTPLRKEHGKFTVSLRAWSDGHVYQSTITDLATVSLGWPRAADGDGTVLALRGFIGWLNGVAAARGDPRRFAWVEYPTGVVVIRPDDLCKLTAAGVLRATFDPGDRFRPFRHHR